MPEARPQGALDRLAGFRVVYAAILAYVVTALVSIELSESLLQLHFESAVAEAARVNPAEGSVRRQIQQRVQALIETSPWTRWGGARVTPIVLGADGYTPIYLTGVTLPPPPTGGPSGFQEADRLLPAITTVQVDVPSDSLLAGSIWVAFGAILVPLLFVHQRRTARAEESVFREAVSARDATIERARSIQSELEKVQGRLAQLEPAERAHVQEIEGLQQEREDLQRRLSSLSERERALRERASRFGDLEREQQALEDLLEDAVQDLEQKDQEIRSLQERLEKGAAPRPAGKARARTSEQLAKRFAALYRNLEVDDRAVQDIVALGDESLRLRAEEALKRLDDDSDAAAVRRKVGGLPPKLSIFELGFAGKGRIYYTRGRARAHRILAVGGKASQKQDLEYLSRLSLD